MSYDEFVIKEDPNPSILWVPEDYDFKSPEQKSSVWYFKNLELRCLPNDYWLCRKKITNKNGNTEMLLKWRHQILSSDKEFADVLFTKGLK